MAKVKSANGGSNEGHNGGPTVEGEAKAVLSAEDVRRYLTDANSINAERAEANQQMSELVKAMVDKGGNRKALSWIRQLDKMNDADGVAVVEALAFMLECHPSLGKQTDLVRRLEQTVAP